MRWVRRITRRNSENAPKSPLDWKLSEERLKGRPKIHWQMQMKEDLGYGSGKKAENRKTWKIKVVLE